MRRQAAAALLLVVVVTATACSATRGPGPLPALTQTWDVPAGWVSLPNAPLRAPGLAWKLDLLPGIEHAINRRSGVIIVAEPSGSGTAVRRVDPSTGAPLWTAQLPGTVKGVEITGPVDKPVAAVTLTTAEGATGFKALDALDGRVLTPEPLAEPGYVQATADLLLLLSFDLKTTGFDRATATQRWHVDREVQLHDGRLLIDDITSNTFGVLDPVSGTPIWERPRKMGSDGGIVGDLVVVTQDETGDDSAAAYDVATGEPRWTGSRLPNLGRTRVARLTQDTILVQSNDLDAAAALDIRTGGLRWQVPVSIADAVVIDGRPLVVDRAGDTLDVFDGRTGKALRTARFEGPSALAGGVAYEAVGRDVVAVGLADLSERWRVSDIGRLNDLFTVPGGFVAVTHPGRPPQMIGFIG